MIRIAVDAMGGDFAPKEQVEGAMLAIKKIPDIEVILYGDTDSINSYLTNSERISIVQTEGVLDMGVKDPISAIRNNRNSSLAKALSSYRSGDSDAIVSSGPTQAIIAGSHLLVRRLKGIKRTAIAPVIPKFGGGSTILLDAGGNLEIKPEFMLQQAFFASVYAKEVMGINDPKVGLINIGTEEGKGRQFDKDSFYLFKDSKHINFVGNIEPKEILTPPCDILISDGFTANIVMKTLEGTAKGMGKMLKQELKKGIIGKIGMLLSARNLKNFKKAMSAEDIGGAMIFGLSAPVIKAQGASKAIGFSNGIRTASEIVRNDVLGKVKTIIESSDSKNG